MAYEVGVDSVKESALQSFMTGVYGWMVAALALSGVSAAFISGSPALQQIVFGNSFVFFGLIIGELILVFWLSASIQKISVGAATVAFLVYSVLNGVTLSVVFIMYTGESVVRNFRYNRTYLWRHERIRYENKV